MDQFRAYTNLSWSTFCRDATALAFGQFLTSRDLSSSRRIQATQPSDITAFLWWLKTCGKGCKAIVNATHCKAVSTTSSTGCPTKPSSCSLRCANESLRINYVSKLSTFYERDLDITSAWRDTLKTGNPVRSYLVSQYMAFTRVEHKKAMLTVKQALALLNSHLREVIVPMCIHMPYTNSALD